MAVYAGEKADYLRQALESLAEQTLEADEIVVVRDGPLTAGLDEILNGSVLGERLKIVTLATNNGLAYALNHGLAQCSGEIVVRLDSDDKALPRRIELQVARFTSEPGLDILGGAAIEIDENGVEGFVWRRPLSDAAIRSALWTNPLIHPSVAFRRAAVAGLGGYDALRKRAEDHDLWVRAAASGLRFANLDEVLIQYRVDSHAADKLTWSAAWERFSVAERAVTVLALPFWLRVPPFIHLLKAAMPKPFRRSVSALLRQIDPRQHARPGK